MATHEVSPAFQQMMDSYRLDLRAANRAQHTIRLYLETLRQFGEFLAEQGLPQRVEAITREHVQRFVDVVRDQHSASTAAIRYRNLKTFFNWLVEQEEIGASPMARMQTPHVPTQPAPVMREETIQKLLKVTAGKTFNDRRDRAMILMLTDTGMRLHELVHLTVANVNVDPDVREAHLEVTKGSRERTVVFGLECAKAIDRYKRARASHPYANSPYLWLGRKGPLTDAGVQSLLKKRVQQAGVDEHVHPHLFRHTQAHHFLADDGQEGDLMALMGWTSNKMALHYGSSMRAERARKKYRSKPSLGDKLR